MCRLLAVSFVMVPILMVSAQSEDPARGVDDRVRARIAALNEAGLGVESLGLAVADTAEIHGFLDRLEAVCALTRALPDAQAARRARYVLINHREDREHFDPTFERSPPRLYPAAAAAAREVGTELLPFRILPSSRALQRIASGPVVDPAAATRPWVSEFVFEPVALRLAVPCAMPAPDIHGPYMNPALKAFVDVGSLGRACGQTQVLETVHRALQQRAVVPSRVDVLEIADDVYRVQVIEQASTVSFGAVPIADGNGAARVDRAPADAIAGSWYANRVTAPATVPSAGGRPLRVLPRPMPTDAEASPIWQRPRDTWSKYRLQERIVLAQTDLKTAQIYDLRRAPTWQPFMEDVILTAGVSVSKVDAPPRLALLVTVDCDDAGLLDAVGQYFGVAAAASEVGRAWLARTR